MSETLFHQGWINDPEAVALVAITLDYPSFAMTGAARVEEMNLPDHVYLWDAARTATGNLLPPRNQGSVGSCVSFGTTRAVEYSMCAEICAREPEEFRALATEPVYAGSRVEVGGGRIRGDGSVGAWAAEFVRRWGVLAREKYGEIDLSHYDEKRCREWGRTGVPDALEPLARAHPVKTTTLVKTWYDAKRALAAGYGIAISSDQGFEMKRDANGIAKPSRTPWAHCMSIAGYATIGGHEYARIDNSWGADAHTGPTGPGNPGPEGFYADSSIVNKMLAQGDSWAFSCVDGFPARKINWHI